MGNPQPSSNPIKMGFVYMIMFPSGKAYIGQTIRNVQKRINEHTKCKGSCIALENAIRMYGIESATVETLLEVSNEQLDYYEMKFIDTYNTLEPNGYNIKSGGTECVHSALSKERMKLKKIGVNNHNYGKPRSEQCRKLISIAKCGENHHFFGKSLSYSHKLNLSKTHKKTDNSLPMYISFCKERPAQYQSAGYAVTNHPTLKNKYFTSKHISMEDKLLLAKEYLQST
jgi:group I intron endonuclease